MFTFAADHRDKRVAAFADVPCSGDTGDAVAYDDDTAHSTSCFAILWYRMHGHLGREMHLGLTTIKKYVLLILFTAVGQYTYAQTIQGVCFSGSPNVVEDPVIQGVKSVGAEWICFIPYAYGPSKEGRITFDDHAGQWWGERSEGIRAMVRMAKARGMKVMLKPHLWLGHGTFTGRYAPDPSIGWEPFEQSYAEYVMHCAELAAELDVDLLCIGTELEKFVLERTNFWQILIDRIGDVYKGPLTYAANWDEVSDFPLWKRMTYIGVDGYFPLCSDETPTLAQLKAGWAQHVEILEELSVRNERPVLFTEVGYCCTATCAVEPWNEDRNATRDESSQALAYSAFFEVFAELDWYAGCFIWKWFADGGSREERHGVGFSPQGKAAMVPLRKAFKGR